MTAPTPEQVDAVARVLAEKPLAMGSKALRLARAILTTTDPAAHSALAASLPTEVMLAALVERGVLYRRDAIHVTDQPDLASYSSDWIEVTP